MMAGPASNVHGNTSSVTREIRVGMMAAPASHVHGNTSRRTAINNGSTWEGLAVPHSWTGQHHCRSQLGVAHLRACGTGR